ncbi:MAG: hypothetical protein ACM3S0_03045 [Acidobacteriota bacterium]
MELRRPFYAVVLMLVVITMSACGSSPTATPTLRPTVAVPLSPTLPPAPTAVPPTSTPIPPTATLVPPTATPVPPQAIAKQQVNVRGGPGVQFPISGKMANNTTAVILGKSEDGKWYQIAFPDAQHPSWVALAFVDVTGPVEQLPVVAVAPPPTPTQVAVAAKTKAPAVTPTLAVPPAKGLIAFISYDSAQRSYVINNGVVDSRSIAGFKLIGTAPADLALNTNASPFAWAPDGSGRVAWVYGGGSTNVLRVTDRAGNDRDLFSHQGVSSPTWSPDSKTIAYIGMDNNFGTQFIVTIAADGSNRNPQFFPARTDKPESFRGVTWGKSHLLFVSNYTGNYEIWRLNSNGTGPLQLTTDGREDGSPAWSPDGTKFAYYSRQTDGSYQIMVANADGSNPHKLTNAGNNFTPTWSPDGNWIAFSSTRGGRLDVYMMDKNGGSVQPLTDKFSESQLPGSWR